MNNKSNKKGIISVVIAVIIVLLLLLLRACTSRNSNSIEDTNKQQEVVEQIQEEPEQAAGAWIDVEDKTITDELREIFNKALQGLTGATYEPQELVAKQVVAGTNYKFLANGSKTTKPITKGTYYITIYEDLDGNVELKDIEVIKEDLPIQSNKDITQMSFWVVVYDQFGNEISRTTAKYGTTIKDPDGKDVVVKGNTYFNTTVNYSNDSKSSITMPKKGDLIDIEGKEYRVLDINGTQAKVMSMFSIPDDYIKFNETSVTTNFSGSEGQKYEGSNLDTYLNTTWYDQQSQSLKNAIVDQNISQNAYQFFGSSCDPANYTYNYQYGWDNDWYENYQYIGNVQIGNRHVYTLDVKDIYDYFGKKCISSNELNEMFFNDKTELPFEPKFNICLRSSYLENNKTNYVIAVCGETGAFSSIDYKNTTYTTRPEFVVDLSKIDFSINKDINYLYFKNLGSNDTYIYIFCYNDTQEALEFQYSYDKKTWNDVNMGTFSKEKSDYKIDIPANTKLYLKAKSHNDNFYVSNENVRIYGDASGYYDEGEKKYIGTYTPLEVGGNIMSLVDAECNIDDISDRPHCFEELFFSNENIENAENLILPAKKLSDYCYSCMFSECYNLKKVNPDLLPATSLDNCESCYLMMFEQCFSLEGAPKLPATKLGEQCYYEMFKKCKTIKDIPELPSQKLENGCYNFMFSNCDEIKTANLPLATLADYCCYGMFANCKGLESAVLPATTLAKNCYDYMFGGCSNLQTVDISATTLAESCCTRMFSGCTSLQSVTLPATTLATKCYNDMFSECTNLQSVTISATTLAENCCNMMFYKCTSLNNLEVAFSSFDDSNNSTYCWLWNASNTGTFKWKGATTGVTRNESHVPSGWTITN